MQLGAKRRGGRPRRKDSPKKTTILLANKMKQVGYQLAVNNGKSFGRLIEDLIAKEADNSNKRASRR